MLLATLFGRFPFLEKLFADSAYQGPIFGGALTKILPGLETEIVKTIRSSERVRAVTQALDRRTHHCVAQPLPPPRQGLGKSQLQRPCVLETRFYPLHATKALQSLMKFWDGLLGLSAVLDRLLEGNNVADGTVPYIQRFFVTTCECQW